MWYQDMNFSTTRGRPYCNDTSIPSLASTEQEALTNNHGLLNHNIPREGPRELTRTKAETRIEKKSLKHQRKWKRDHNYTKSWYDRGAEIYQAEKYRKGAR
ncbi:unnamed protein product [Eruca vesicaria subsp. sativa]|uniref:Uncharacterized protein n=1 Tax=Eruca vesicaria subsp. sativa TaxID=29727 RepID=A0ABC8LMN7_ERUVS|nr:unnamed protein product [Eruca vesicaria subsp. sativa]